MVQSVNIAKRFLTTGGRLLNKNIVTEMKEAPYGSFRTFAEYREFIIRKDPETLEARNRIMMSNGKPESCPESEAENSNFGDNVKKVAYNSK